MHQCLLFLKLLCGYRWSADLFLHCTFSEWHVTHVHVFVGYIVFCAYGQMVKIQVFLYNGVVCGFAYFWFDLVSYISVTVNRRSLPLHSWKRVSYVLKFIEYCSNSDCLECGKVLLVCTVFLYACNMGMGLCLKCFGIDSKYKNYHAVVTWKTNPGPGWIWATDSHLQVVCVNAPSQHRAVIRHALVHVDLPHMISAPWLVRTDSTENLHLTFGQVQQNLS